MFFKHVFFFAHLKTSNFSQILSVEEEKLMEIKYVRRSPRASKTNIETTDDIKSDGVFKFYFSRIHVVLMFKLIYDLEVVQFFPKMMYCSLNS